MKGLASQMRRHFRRNPWRRRVQANFKVYLRSGSFKGKDRTKKDRVADCHRGNESQNWLGELQGLGIITQREEDVWDCDQNMRVRHHFEERTSLHIPYRSAGGGPRPE